MKRIPCRIERLSQLTNLFGRCFQSLTEFVLGLMGRVGESTCYQTKRLASQAGWCWRSQQFWGPLFKQVCSILWIQITMEYDGRREMKRVSLHVPSFSSTSDPTKHTCTDRSVEPIFPPIPSHSHSTRLSPLGVGSPKSPTPSRPPSHWPHCPRRSKGRRKPPTKRVEREGAPTIGDEIACRHG